MRHRALPWLRASWRLLAGEEMRRRGSGCGASADSRSRGRCVGVPRACLRLRAGRAPSNPASLDRSAYLFVFPAIGAVGAIVLAFSILNHNGHWPFYMVALIFVSAFGTLALSFWPYIIPFVITIAEAAAPPSSLAVMFWGAVVVFPLMLLFTLISYSVFRGKVRTTAGHYQ